MRRLVPVRRPEGVKVDEVGRASRLAPAEEDARDDGERNDGREQRRGVCLDLCLAELDRQLGQGSRLLGLLQARGREGQGGDADERDEVVDDGGEGRLGDLAAEGGGDVCCCCCCCFYACVFFCNRRRKRERRESA